MTSMFQIQSEETDSGVYGLNYWLLLKVVTAVK